MLGQFVASIGGDNKFKLWRESSSQETKGRRFKCVFSQSPSDGVPYAAFDSLMRGDDTFLALVSHSGLLTFQGPTDPTSAASWRELDALYPFGQRSRSDEPRFGISFHHAAGPPSQTLAAGLDQDVISFAVSSAHAVKVFRTMVSGDEGLHLHEMLEIRQYAASINSISWAPGCNNPREIIAVASDDRSIGLFEIHLQRTLPENLPNKKLATQRTIRRESKNHRSAPASGISEGLAGTTDSRDATRVAGDLDIKHEAKELARLVAPTSDTPMGKLQWSVDGMIRYDLWIGRADTAREYTRCCL
ncbi:MAG: hypothetical protein OHK93_008068 [Ramalina farinacea]|uniref:Uncharacterized protein n=1 Tax=Ramalina farinacea TaxID=258253 RepID=A0AA43TY74_9LECA|nr:hypothetical protein [Ramalina farinacea]